MLGQKQGCAVESLAGFVEDAGEGLEDVRDLGGDVEDDVHAGSDRSCRQAHLPAPGSSASLLAQSVRLP